MTNWRRVLLCGGSVVSLRWLWICKLFFDDRFVARLWRILGALDWCASCLQSGSCSVRFLPTSLMCFLLSLCD
ncbi:hypothetical protein KC19_7G067300 [Ceratodon purpureus]|uniref:Uncharacterized protein n=1 Tax=Ceratodon purpureus TaxID=3225 RepID=A0A8T0HBJ4_CERPU|nr:hypothetical protein KC19_7G067300 [Ceratodon purpureus]